MEKDAIVLRFGDFRLALAERRLTGPEGVVELGSRYFDALSLLVRHPSALVSKERFMDEVWRGIPVTDEALTQCIRTLRRALADEPGNPRFIETVPKHGYRFIAAVEQVAPSVPSILTSRSPASRIAGATTLGGFTAGVLGGLFYGVLGTSGGAPGIVTVLLLSTALALLGAAAIGMGLGLACLWRGESSWAMPVGGAIGGLAVGALGSIAAASGMEAVTGIFPGRVTGMFEGMALGLAAGVVLAIKAAYPRRPAISLLIAITTGAALASAVALGGGRFLGGTLAQLQARFPASQLDLQPIGMLFGEASFGAAAQLGTALCEGATFTVCILVANWLLARRALKRATRSRAALP